MYLDVNYSSPYDIEVYGYRLDCQRSKFKSKYIYLYTTFEKNILAVFKKK